MSWLLVTTLPGVLLASSAAPTGVAGGWQNLSSGALGAILGSILTGVVTWLVTKSQTTRLLDEQRRESARERDAERERAGDQLDKQHRDYLRRREETALADLLPVLSELQQHAPALLGHQWRMNARGAPWWGHRMADGAEHVDYAYRAMIQAQHVDLPLITTVEFRQRYRALVGLVEQLVNNKVDEPYRRRAEGDVIRYIGHVRHCVKNLLHGLPLPEGNPPPDLNRATDNALWAPVETDPEDTYYPEPEEPRRGADGSS